MSLPDHLCYTNSDDEDYHPRTSTIFTKRVKYLNTIIENFWTRWRHEYFLELRESHWWYEGGRPDKVDVGDVVIIHDESPRGLWKLGIIKKTLKGRDKEVRGAVVRVGSGSQPSSFLRRPIERLYPLEVRSVASNAVDQVATTTDTNDSLTGAESSSRGSTVDTTVNMGPTSMDPNTTSTRPRRKAATEARDKIVARLLEHST